MWASSETTICCPFAWFSVPTRPGSFHIPHVIRTQRRARDPNRQHDGPDDVAGARPLGRLRYSVLAKALSRRCLSLEILPAEAGETGGRRARILSRADLQRGNINPRRCYHHATGFGRFKRDVWRG